MSTVDAQEIERFSRLAARWWDAEGPFRPLHEINPLRIGYIRGLAMQHFRRDEAPRPLAGLTLLDIGCGGGLIAEPFARLGAAVTGIDASGQNIGTAATHAKAMGLDIDYRHTTAEDLQATGAQFDIVLALEIIEHVANPESFVQACAALAKPGGLLVFSTLNRTAKAYALAILGAEYVCGLLPRGTHTWKKFIRPHELAGWLRQNGTELLEMQGMKLHPLSFKWSLAPGDVSVNYLMAFSINS